MYPWELEQFIKDRDYKLGGDDLIKATSIEENPQLNHIKYNSFNSKYEMWDKFSNYYIFEAIDYEEAKVKKLVKYK